MTTQSQRFGAVLRKMTLSFCSILAMLLLIEAVLQWRDRGSSIKRWAIPDKRYGFIHRKDYHQRVTYSQTDVVWDVSINSQGFRGEECDLSSPGVLRILLLGDSFTFGYGIDNEQTFGRQLERRLIESGVPACVMNAGVTGWGTLQELLYARDHLRSLEPQIIILTYCENDPIEDEVFLRGAAHGLLPQFPGKRWIRDHSLLYAWIYDALYSRLYKRLFRANEQAVAIESTKESNLVKTDTPDYLDQWWQRTLKEINGFGRDFCAHNPSGLLLVQATEFWKPEIRTPLSTLGSNGIKYVDLTADMPNASYEKVRLAYDPHWNEQMNSISADRLFREICLYTNRWASK